MTGHPLQPTFGQKMVEALGLPKNTISFNLRVRVDSIPTVTVKYYPEPIMIGDDDDIITEIKRYELREIEGPTDSGMDLGSEPSIGILTCPVCKSTTDMDSAEKDADGNPCCSKCFPPEGPK